MTRHHQHHHPNDHSNIPLLTCALLAALTTGGPTYAFGLYGGDLKESLQLTQSQLDTISSANFCAGLLSWLPGLMVDRYGVRFSLSLGGALGACFMTAYWAVARKLLYLEHSIILPALCGLGVLIFMTNGLVIGSIFKLIVSTCAPHTKGSAVGAAKGYVGLGSGVYACLFRALKTPQISDLDFLPLAAILAVLAGSLPALLLLPGKHEMDLILESTPRLRLDQTTALHLRVVYVGLVVLGTIVVGATLSALSEDSNSTEFDLDDEENYLLQQTPRYLRALMILLAWIGPIMALMFLPAKATKLHEDVDEETLDAASERDDEDTSASQCGESNPLLLKTQNSAPALAYGAEITASVQVSGLRGLLGRKASVITEEVENLNLAEMLQTFPAWLFAWIAVISVGGGTMITNNMGQMVESLYLPKHTTTPAALALFSVAQAVSRVMTGAISDSALSWKIQQRITWHGMEYSVKGIPRPAFLIASSFGGAVAHLFLSSASTQSMFLVGVCFSGAAFGMVWPLMVLIVGEVFGTANMGANYMFYDGLSSALGTLMLSKYVTQTVYEEHIKSESERTCYGRECFGGAHIVIEILSFSCVLASYWFYRNTQHVYAKHT